MVLAIHAGRLRLLAVMAVAVATSLLIAGPVYGVPVTRVVDNDGMASATNCNATDVAHTTIQDGVDAAVSGDTVRVCPGTYDEQVVIDGLDLTLEGFGSTTIVRPSAPAVLSSLYTYPAGTFWPGTVMASIITVTNGDAVTIRNLKVDGVNVTTVPAGAARVAGVLYGESGGTVNNVTVTTMVVDGYSTRSYGVDLSATGTSRTVEVKNSHITDWSRNGIQAQGGSLYADLHDNVLVGPGDTLNADAVPNGILFIHDVDGNASGNAISGVHTSVTDSRSAGILFYDPLAPGIVVASNNISDVDDGIIVGHNANRVVIVQNYLHDNLEVGIHLEDGAKDTTITGNTITDNAMAGIRFAGATDPGTPDTPPGTGNVAHRNLIWGNGVGIADYDTQVFEAERNWWGDISGPSGAGYGDGDSVTTNVTYGPWCFNSSCTLFATGGTDGADTLYGTSGADIIFGFDGADVIKGLAGSDRLYGGVGEDVLQGAKGADFLSGGDDDDVLKGGRGADTLLGHGGADYLDGGAGSDSCSGGPGADTVTAC
jgi:parallel beta-helix repeat protein